MNFTVYVHPEPQGSAKAYVINGRAAVTSDNKKLKPYRHVVTAAAIDACMEAGYGRPFAGKHVPIAIQMDFYFDRPPSVPKKRAGVVVKPDIDKLARATLDSLTGVLFMDDAQVVWMIAKKHYGTPERVEISTLTEW